jgi:MoxR-like ATPase
MDQQEIASKAARVVDEIEKVIIGKRDAVEGALVGLLCAGHVLVEDIPGVGKTMLARALARALGCTFRRIQFTPDLLPADVTGTSIYNQKLGEFQFKPGPVFGNIILADEINRATPKAQASLLECMEEGQITVDGITHRLPQPFFIIATENPIEYHGTYPLPEGQLDRFLLRLELGYPSHEQEVAVMERQIKQHPIETVGPVLSTEEVVELQGAIRDVYLEKSLKNYIVQVVEATRHHAGILLGASPRGSLGLMRASQATAAMAGRDYVLPDDIKRLAPAILSHRLILRPETKVRGIRPGGLIREILEETPVPTEL